jgi:DNA-binding XRE family transcriptional regulator
MSETKTQRPPVAWTDAERADMRAIAQRMQAERPTPDQLVASGNYDGPLPLGVYQDYVLAMLELRHAREGLGLSLTDAAGRCGIERGSLCKLESGQTNPTFQTIARYAAGIGKRIRIVVEDLTPAEAADTNSPAMA